jgi:hypothetical protein
MAEPAESAQQEGAEEQAPAVARAPKKAGGPGVREFIQENARLLASVGTAPRTQTSPRNRFRISSPEGCSDWG